MRTFQTLLVEERGRTSIITINKPTSLNSLDSQTIHELCEVLLLLEKDNDTRGIIFTGSGDKAFVAGADIKEFVGLDVKDAEEKAKSGHFLMDRISSFGKPIIAAVNGFALGGGLELAMACHIRVVSENAKMGLPEVSLGIIPGYGGTQRLPQLVGRGKALEMILTGEMVDAKDALQWGLVNYVVGHDQLLDSCIELLEKIYVCSAIAVANATKAVNAGINNPLDGMANEIALFAESFATKDCQEGVQAFIERRKPKF